MKRSLRLSLALVFLAPTALAQAVTPTHTFETPLAFGSFAGDVIFATMIGPPAGESIWKTELRLEWTTDGIQAASLFGLHLGTDALEHGSQGEWEVVGSDLGWGSTPGTHSANIETDLFNDTILGGPFGGPTFNLTMEQVGGGGLWGDLGPRSRLVFHLGPRVDVDVDAVSLSSGGAQTLALKAGPTVGGGMGYVVLGSVTGTTPGLTLDGFAVPLVFDDYTLLTVTSANQPPFSATLGNLDGGGTGTAQITLAPGSPAGLAGLTLHHALVGFDLVGGIVLGASNAVDLALLP